MSRIIRMNRRFQRLSRSEAGMTLLELIIACSILLILFFRRSPDRQVHCRSAEGSGASP